MSNKEVVVEGRGMLHGLWIVRAQDRWTQRPITLRDGGAQSLGFRNREIALDRHGLLRPGTGPNPGVVSEADRIIANPDARVTFKVLRNGREKVIIKGKGLRRSSLTFDPYAMNGIAAQNEACREISIAVEEVLGLALVGS
ncbi:MAG: hypothetical protein AAFR44_10520 [Pseudomonadota bacterium]